MKTSHHYQGPLYAATIIPEEFRARSVAGFNRLLDKSGEYQPAVFQLLEDLALHAHPQMRLANVYTAYRTLTDLLPDHGTVTRKKRTDINKYLAQQYDELGMACPRLPEVPSPPPCKYEERRNYVRTISEANSLL